jgi:hypothetical protein
MRAVPTLLVCALAVASAPGCGDLDAGTAQYPGTILYQDPKGAFEFRLLEPPWIPPFVYTAADMRLTFSVVPPPDATVSSDPNVLLGQALYALQFSQVTGDPASAIAEVKGSIPGGSPTQTGSVDTSTGTTGVEMAWQEETDVYHRDAFMAGAATPTFRLHFTAQKAIADDPMVTQMISSFRAK